MNKKIKIFPRDKDVELFIDGLLPSKNYVPKWYKNMPLKTPNINGVQVGSGKKCVPFLDSFISGYTQELICDIEIKYDGVDGHTGKDKIIYKYDGLIKPMSTRTEDNGEISILPHFNGYYNADFHWNTFWEPKTPKGYSTIYMHPMNRWDLPFQTFNGIIDTDKWYMAGPLPFLIKQGFEGTIPKGTPIYQVLFIKRNSWKSIKQEYKNKVEKKFNQQIEEQYKKMFWQKKEYK
jgi:hypothetical protein